MYVMPGQHTLYVYAQAVAAADRRRAFIQSPAVTIARLIFAVLPVELIFQYAELQVPGTQVGADLTHGIMSQMVLILALVLRLAGHTAENFGKGAKQPELQYFQAAAAVLQYRTALAAGAVGVPAV
jgi:hypothetical protein